MLKLPGQAARSLSSTGESLLLTLIRPQNYDDLDIEIYEGRESYAAPLDRDRKKRWLTQAINFHLANSPSFARLAKTGGFALEHLHPADYRLEDVPLCSSGSFKKSRIYTTVQGPTKLCISSGTSGTKSVVPRDSRTLERFAGSILHGLREFIGHVDSRKAFILGPRSDEAGDLWFSYSISLAQLLQDTVYFVDNGRFDAQALYQALESSCDDDVVIVTPPSLLFAFMEWMEETGAHALNCPKTYVLTAGGWKSHVNKSVSRELLEETVATRLGVPPFRQRDLFNMVELNTVLFECEHHFKHIPPWLEVIVRRPEDMTAADPGEEGIICFLDPTAVSYPAFILSDDFGTLEPGECPCGRYGPRLSINRRLAGIEERGCALKMACYAQPEQ